jgi:hypothetical protein
MNHTTQLFGTGINCFQPLDGRKWMVVIYLGVPQNSSEEISAA